MLGQGDWKFAVATGWAKISDLNAYGPTHGSVVVDRAGNIYASTDTKGVFVLAPDGTLQRVIAQGMTNLHGLLLREEGGSEFLYGALNNAGKVVKLTLEGRIEWEILAPLESGFYDQPAYLKTSQAAFQPTSVVLGPDGRIYVADGYGASVVHVFNASRKYLKTIGTRGEGRGQFKTCHGLAIDPRYGAPRLLVVDRGNRRLVHLDLEGRWLGVLMNGLRRPCSLSFSGGCMAVAELAGRVIIADKSGRVLAAIGDTLGRKRWLASLLEPRFRRDGPLVAPHGLAFDRQGNLFVTEWSSTGRIMKLQRVPANAA